ncbi:MAG: helix-hairpin-helix domain-containing protein [Armatimonadetes bacterium]|nr:helix-hairpin-helix domain-containing protein [Armatimonadota bacterium]
MFYLSRAEQVALVAILALLLTGAGVLSHAKGQRSADTGRSQPIFVPADEGVDGQIVVDVSGSVARPGVYRLHGAARVADAIERAGGAAAAADLAVLNLAARLQDGDKLVVPTRSDISPPAERNPSAGASARRISLNQATAEELESLPGIGPVYADRIVAYREKKLREEGRGFESTDELLNVPGIGSKRFAAVRDLVAP